jgi:hypothetical protein
LNRRIIIAALLGLVLGVALRSSLSWEVRRAQGEVDEYLSDVDRYVDFGVLIKVVRQDLENGRELIDGKPPLVVLRTISLGGMVDTKSSPPTIVGPSRDPKVWYCSEEQEPLILHEDALPLGLLVYGSEGAGKTTCLAMWHFVRVLEAIGEGREGGQTAPTEPRLEMVRAEMKKLYRPEWYRYKASDDLFVFADGGGRGEEVSTRIRLVSTHKQSAAEGSRVQGFNWSWCGRDEAQDQVDAHEDIENRGRDAPGGGARYRQLATATAKDHPQWRRFRDMLLTSIRADGEILWKKFTLLITRSPFVSREFIETKRASMSERSFRRRMLAEDVPPERVLYNTWDAGDHLAPLNLRPIPESAVDVTAEVLRHWGGNLQLLAGHDPGKLFDVTILMKAYRLPKIKKPVWWVVGEVTTERSTTDAHVKELLHVAREKFHCNTLDWKGRPSEDGARMLVRADPYSDSGAGDAQPDRSVYTVLRLSNILIHPAAYVAKADKLKVGRVPKEGRIDMMLTLLCAADKQTRRLYVDCDERRQPVAPRLVEAFETCERDGTGAAETQRKDQNDMSHWPAATGYGLWVLERPRVEDS